MAMPVTVSSRTIAAVTRRAGVGAEQHRPGGGHPARLLEGVPPDAGRGGWAPARLGEAQHLVLALGEQLGGAVGMDPGQGQQHPGVAGAGPADHQGPAVDLDPLLPVLEQRRRHERGHGQGGRVEHLAVLEQLLHPPAQLPVEHPQPPRRAGLSSWAARAAWRLPTSSSSVTTRALAAGTPAARSTAWSR